MKTKLIRGIALVLAMIMCMAVGAFAATNLQEIKAYLNHDLAIRYDGELQTMYDANGNRVLPISYNGTTYLPIRAVGNMMGIDVLWDGENYQVLLGKTGQAIDFIENIRPYTGGGYSFAQPINSDGRILKIGENNYSHWIEINGRSSGYYDLGGKYKKITIKVYTGGDSCTLQFIGDNDEILGDIAVKEKMLPMTYEIDVTGVQQFVIKNVDGMKSDTVYILEAYIE